MEKGYKVKVEVKGLEAYKDAFLVIYNNYKDDKRLLCFENDYDNGIYVTCCEDQKAAVEDWLEFFGTVSSEPVYIKTIYNPITDAEFDKSCDDNMDIEIVIED